MTMEVKCGLLVCPVCESSKLNVQRTSVACLECGEPLWSAASPTTAWSVTADIIVAAPPPRFSPERPYGVTIITDDEPVFAPPGCLIDKPESGAQRELRAIREGIEASAWHYVAGERMKRILVAETAIARIDAALSSAPEKPTTGTPHFEPVLNGPELWEIVFGVLEGDVPDDLTDEVFQRIADAINEAFPRAECLLDPSNIYAEPLLDKPEAGEAREPTPEMIKAGEEAYWRKHCDMTSPTPTEEPGIGPIGYAYLAMRAAALSFSPLSAGDAGEIKEVK